MKNLVFWLLAASFVAGSAVLSVGPAVSAFSQTNVLVKGSLPAVYWVADNGQRYEFPNIQTFWSWFPTEKLAETIVLTDSELVSIPFGGTVTYRPGAKLVKFPTSPRVYAVSRYGILNWVTTESLAATHYGQGWTTRVDDIPESLLTTYSIGAPIVNAWDYHGSSQYHGTPTPSTNLLATLPPGNMTLELSKYEITRGEPVTLTAKLTSSPQIQNLVIDLFADNATLIKSCAAVTACTAEVTLTGTEVTRTFTAHATYAGPSGMKTLDSHATTLRLFMPQTGSQGTILATSEVVAPSNELPTVRVVATAMNISIVEAGLTIRIYRATDNALIQTCSGRVTCVAKDRLPSLTQSTDVSYFAIANTDLSQQVGRAETKVTVLPSGWYPTFNSYTFTAAEYGTKTGLTSEIEQQSMAVSIDHAEVRSEGKPIRWTDDNVTIRPGAPVQVEAKVTAAGASDRMSVEIREPNGVIHKVCSGTGSVTCVADIAFLDEYRNHFFIVRAHDQNGRIRDFRLADFVYVGGRQGFGGAVRILADKTVVKRGETVFLSTKIMGETTPISQLTTRIFNLETGTLVTICTWTTECRTKTVVDTNLPAHIYYALAADPQGREMHASFAPSPVTVTQ